MKAYRGKDKKSANRRFFVSGYAAQNSPIPLSITTRISSGDT